MTNRTAIIFNTSLVIMPLLSIASLALKCPPLTITLFTISYHLIANMAAGVLSKVIPLREGSPCFTVSDREMEWYGIIGVRKWKDRAPTYEPEAFRTLDMKALRRATEGAEVCHLISIFFSILPIPVALISDYLRPGMAAFAITSALAVFFNLALIDIQRFNRYRIDRIIRKTGIIS